MGPAQAMGTFLRTWRSEWAGLTRAQLAIALSAATGKGKTIKPGTIREWETGQPPKSTSELESLLQVMRRHGLTIPEVQQFRTAVFAACLDRHHPGLLGQEDLAHSPDVEAAAWAIVQREDARGVPMLISVTEKAPIPSSMDSSGGTPPRCALRFPRRPVAARQLWRRRTGPSGTSSPRVDHAALPGRGRRHGESPIRRIRGATFAILVAPIA